MLISPERLRIIEHWGYEITSATAAFLCEHGIMGPDDILNFPNPNIDKPGFLEAVKEHGAGEYRGAIEEIYNANYVPLDIPKEVAAASRKRWGTYVPLAVEIVFSSAGITGPQDLQGLSEKKFRAKGLRPYLGLIERLVALYQARNLTPTEEKKEVSSAPSSLLPEEPEKKEKPLNSSTVLKPEHVGGSQALEKLWQIGILSISRLYRLGFEEPERLKKFFPSEVAWERFNQLFKEAGIHSRIEYPRDEKETRKTLTPSQTTEEVRAEINLSSVPNQKGTGKEGGEEMPREVSAGGLERLSAAARAKLAAIGITTLDKLVEEVRRDPDHVRKTLGRGRTIQSVNRVLSSTGHNPIPPSQAHARLLERRDRKQEGAPGTPETGETPGLRTVSAGEVTGKEEPTPSTPEPALTPPPEPSAPAQVPTELPQEGAPALAVPSTEVPPELPRLTLEDVVRIVEERHRWLEEELARVRVDIISEVHQALQSLNPPWFSQVAPLIQNLVDNWGEQNIIALLRILLNPYLKK